jgi:hypothetical protein
MNMQLHKELARQSKLSMHGGKIPIFGKIRETRKQRQSKNYARVIKGSLVLTNVSPGRDL